MKIIRIFSLVLFIACLSYTIYGFVLVQVLRSYPFYLKELPAVWGTDIAFRFWTLQISYTGAMEICVLLSFVGLVISWIDKFQKFNILKSIGKTMMIYGGIGAVVIYIETTLFWGRIWHYWNYKIWSGLPDGGGYPWWTERVGYNTDFIKSSSFSEINPDCLFLNYGELFFISLIILIIGCVLWKYYKHKLINISRQSK